MSSEDEVNHMRAIGGIVRRHIPGKKVAIITSRNKISVVPDRRARLSRLDTDNDNDKKK